jgi:glycosyltransferase involved in cell wall biosynthesis
MISVIKNANRIIAVSENTKSDIIDILNVDEDKIDIIYHGYNESKKGNKTDRLGKYILFIGRRATYKNFNTFTEAICQLLKREKDMKLICTGKPFNREEIAHLTKLGIADQTFVITTGDNKLNDLYYNALVFVFPSLYEGFGMPILEAFTNDCPVCLSNTSCFPEIAGNAGAYFDPNDHGSILDAVEKVVYNKAFADELILNGQTRLKNFKWTKTIQETLDSYNKALN